MRITEIDPTTATREEMIDYLVNHFKYHTLHSWNQSTSYAHCVKVNHLDGLTNAERDKLYDLVQADDFYDEINFLMNEFAIFHKHAYQVGFNGRSGGYIVLYQGGKHADGRIYTKPGLSMDQGETFADWDDDSIRARVELVREFDDLIVNIFDHVKDMIERYDVVEEIVMVPKKFKALKERESSEGPPPYDAATATGMYDPEGA